MTDSKEMVSIGSLLLLVFNSCPVFFGGNIARISARRSDDDVTSRTFQNTVIMI